MIKEILECHGYEQSSTVSPRIIIKTAYAAGMLKNEEVWLKALSARNNVSHSYNENIALTIVEKTREFYVDMFESLKIAVENN